MKDTVGKFIYEVVYMEHGFIPILIDEWKGRVNMDWKSMYLQSNKPTFEQIGEYVNNPLWQELNDTLSMSYDVMPQIEYSKCSMQRGWNVKYKKKGKSLCTLYPEQDYYKVLIVISEHHVEDNLFIETFCGYIKKLYRDTKFFNGSKWLMIDIKESSTLEDVKELISMGVN